MPPDRVTIAAHAKVNLFLRVLAREDSGYHSLETVFALLELADRLIVERIDHGVELEVRGAQTGPDEANLAHRAAVLMLQATGRPFGVRIHLEKRIPVAGGLGGGSSDGAAALRAVNALANNVVPAHEVLQIATRLGSDVAFFASGAPLALAWGRGERLFRITPPAAAPALLVLPHFGVSTPDAYAQLDRTGAGSTSRGAVTLDAEAFATWAGIGRLGGNDFEVPIFGREPQLRELFEDLSATRPLLARLSGSGSALVALYRTESERDAAAEEMRADDRELIPTFTRSVAAPGPKRPPKGR